MEIFGVGALRVTTSPLVTIVTVVTVVTASSSRLRHRAVDGVKARYSAAICHKRAEDRRRSHRAEYPTANILTWERGICPVKPLSWMGGCSPMICWLETEVAAMPCLIATAPSMATAEENDQQELMGGRAGVVSRVRDWMERGRGLQGSKGLVGIRLWSWLGRTLLGLCQVTPALALLLDVGDGTLGAPIEGRGQCSNLPHGHRAANGVAMHGEASPMDHSGGV